MYKICDLHFSDAWFLYELWTQLDLHVDNLSPSALLQVDGGAKARQQSIRRCPAWQLGWKWEHFWQSHQV